MYSIYVSEYDHANVLRKKLLAFDIESLHLALALVRSMARSFAQHGVSPNSLRYWIWDGAGQRQIWCEPDAGVQAMRDAPCTRMHRSWSNYLRVRAGSR